MLNPTPDVQEALQRLSARPEGVLIRDYLQRCVVHEHASILRERDESVVRMTQGHLQVLIFLLDFWKP